MVASFEKTNVYLYNLLTFVKCFQAKYKKASKATHRTVPPYFAARFGFFFIYIVRETCAILVKTFGTPWCFTWGKWFSSWPLAPLWIRGESCQGCIYECFTVLPVSCKFHTNIYAKKGRCPNTFWPGLWALIKQDEILNRWPLFVSSSGKVFFRRFCV